MANLRVGAEKAHGPMTHHTTVLVQPLKHAQQLKMLGREMRSQFSTLFVQHQCIRDVLLVDEVFLLEEAPKMQYLRSASASGYVRHHSLATRPMR